MCRSEQSSTHSPEDAADYFARARWLCTKGRARTAVFLVGSADDIHAASRNADSTVIIRRFLGIFGSCTMHVIGSIPEQDTVLVSI